MDFPRMTRMLPCTILIISPFFFTDCSKKTAPAGTVTKSAPVARNYAPSPPPSGPKNIEKGILYYVNLHRYSIGLSLLQLNKVESTVAAQHSRDMASGRVPFGHTGLQSRVNIITRQIGPVTATGENVALGQRSPKEVVADWLQSPGHRRNIEGDFKLTGIGLARDDKGLIYYTQIFTR